MNFREKLYFKVLPLALAFFFGMMVFGTIFRPGIRDGWLPIHISNLFAVLFYGLFVLFIWSIVIKKIRKSKSKVSHEKRVLFIFFSGLILAQALFLSNTSLPMAVQCVEPAYGQRTCAWDFNFVAESAAESAVTGNTSVTTIDYLHRHQNNIPTFYLLKAVFRAAHAIGIDNLQLVGTTMNVLDIDTALLLIYLSVRKLFNKKKAAFALAVGASTLPMLFLYAPIFYTDTLSLPFPIAMIYLYSIYREQKSFWLIPIITVVAFIGSMIKFSVIIVLVAILIDILLHMKKPEWKKTVLAIVTIVAMTAGMLSAYSALSYKYIHSRAMPTSITTPWTHYVMMGLGGNGQYSLDDDKKTSSYQTEESAIAYNIEEIKKRLARYNVSYPLFLYYKAIGTWSEGTYESVYRLNNMNIYSKDYNPSDFQKTIVATNDTDRASLVNFMQAVQVLFLIALVIFGIKSFGRRDGATSVMQLSVMGLAIFLSIWETNPRYIVNYLPIIIALVAPQLYSMSPVIISAIRKSYLSLRLKVLRY